MITFLPLPSVQGAPASTLAVVPAWLASALAAAAAFHAARAGLDVAPGLHPARVAVVLPAERVRWLRGLAADLGVELGHERQGGRAFVDRSSPRASVEVTPAGLLRLAVEAERRSLSAARHRSLLDLHEEHRS